MRKLLLAMLPLVFALLPSGVASAHVLATDGNIGAVLHISPDDNPTSGTPTSFTLSFDDTTGRFKLPNCDCSAAIQENGKTLSTISLNNSHQLDSTNTFTFPRANAYTLEITGTPKTANAFQSFALSYTVRVTSGDLQTQSVPLALWAGLGAMIGLILLAAYAMEAGYNAKGLTKNNGKF